MEKKINPKRLELIELSNKAKAIRKDMEEGATDINEALFWSSRTINYMLLNHMYETDGATEFNTFNQWKEKNCTIIKGSKSFLIWGQPLKGGNKAKEENTEEDENGYEYFPICYLFSNKQVISREQTEEKEEVKESAVQEPLTSLKKCINLDLLF